MQRVNSNTLPKKCSNYTTTLINKTPLSSIATCLKPRSDLKTTPKGYTVACKSLEAPTFFQFLTHNFSQTFSNNLKILPNVLYIVTIQNPFHKIFKTHRSINFYCFFEKASVQKFRKPDIIAVIKYNNP